MKKMIWISTVTVILAVLLLAPIPPSRQHVGVYNYTSHLMYCRTELACLHEVAHRLDQMAGFPSQSAEFEQALVMYLIFELRQPQLTQTPVYIMDLTYRDGTLSDNKKEIYAYLFAWAGGQPERMADSLRKFYDWDNANRLMQVLRADWQLYWFN